MPITCNTELNWEHNGKSYFEILEKFVEDKIIPEYDLNFDDIIKVNGLHSPMNQACDGGFPYLAGLWYRLTKLAVPFDNPNNIGYNQRAQQTKINCNGDDEVPKLQVAIQPENDGFSFGVDYKCCDSSDCSTLANSGYVFDKFRFLAPTIKNSYYIGTNGNDSFGSGSCANEKVIMKNLATFGPISYSVYFRRCYSLYETGIAMEATCKYLDPNGETENAHFHKYNHAILLVGYGTVDGLKYWKIQNSWGSGWGVNGYFKIERSRQMCQDLTVHLELNDLEVGGLTNAEMDTIKAGISGR